MGQITNQSHIDKWRLWEWRLYLYYSKNLTAINTNVPHQLIQVTVFFPRTKHHDHPIHGFILQTNPFQNLCFLKPPSWEWLNMNFFINVSRRKTKSPTFSFLNISRHWCVRWSVVLSADGNAIQPHLLNDLQGQVLHVSCVPKGGGSRRLANCMIHHHWACLSQHFGLSTR